MCAGIALELCLPRSGPGVFFWLHSKRHSAQMKFPAIKETLVTLGRFIPAKSIHYANGILNYLNLGRWFHDRNLRVPVRCADRPLLYNEVAKSLREPVSYVEFGVFKGDTMRHWSKLLNDPKSSLDGFDSFEGLPEDWGPVDKKLFDIKGQMPRFDDPRVRLFKGWFTDTVPGYVKDFKPNPTLVLHLDADLYSSTIFVLRQFRPFLKPGVVLIFDEFFDREHELKALNEFLKEEPFGIECLAGTRSLTQVAFRITSERTTEHRN
jgi:hypothetical protein